MADFFDRSHAACHGDRSGCYPAYDPLRTGYYDLGVKYP